MNPTRSGHLAATLAAGVHQPAWCECGPFLHRAGRPVQRRAAQCFRVPNEVLRWLARQDWCSTIHWNARMASDIILGELLNTHPDRPNVAFHIPCLVEHVGNVSACFPTRPLGRSLKATNFAGADFDALSLWPPK